MLKENLILETETVEIKANYLKRLVECNDVVVTPEIVKEMEDIDKKISEIIHNITRN